MKWVFDDGGREASGYKGRAGDCVCRAVAIATGKPYVEVYEDLSSINSCGRKTKSHPGRGRYSVRSGINVRSRHFKEYMRGLGWRWVPTMGIGTGCKVHLADGELPMGRLVVSVSRHYTAVIDGVVHDTHDPQRQTQWFGPGGECVRVSERCVYGYWEKTA